MKRTLDNVLQQTACLVVNPIVVRPPPPPPPPPPPKKKIKKSLDSQALFEEKKQMREAGFFILFFISSKTDEGGRFLFLFPQKQMRHVLAVYVYFCQNVESSERLEKEWHKTASLSEVIEMRVHIP